MSQGTVVDRRASRNGSARPFPAESANRRAGNLFALSRLPGLILWGSLVLWGGLAAPLSAATWEGLEVTMDASWPGCGTGGYCPIRITVVNRGQPRTMRLTFMSDVGRAPTVSRTLAVQTERVRFSLLVPCVGHDAYGRVQVTVDGRDVPQLGHPVSLPLARDSGTAGPAVLLIDTKDADWSRFKTAVEQIVFASVSSGGGSFPYVTPQVGDDHKYIAPSELPTEWQAYTGLDIVIVSQAMLERLEAEVRRALLRWVETGGTLLVHSVGPLTGESGLEGRLGLSPERPGETWSEHAVEQFRSSLRPRLLGLVGALSVDPFHDFSAEAWVVLLESIGRPRWEWSQRHGFSARHPMRDFLDFLIPSVKGVPVFAYLVLITLFSIAIGPVNYLYLWKQRRLNLLVVTIPLIAAVTSVSLFAYSVVAHGFSTRARVRSLTLLDQSTNTAVSGSRVSFYSGLAPSGGLRFSRDTAIYPLWPPDGGFESGLVDWSEQQHLASGWLRSRTRTQCFLLTHRAERGRLEVTPADGGVSVANGLAWPLASLVVADDTGKLFFGEHLATGEGRRLVPVSSAQVTEVRHRLTANAPQLADHLQGVTYAPPYRHGGWYLGNADMIETSYEDNQAELLLRRLAESSVKPGEQLGPRSYLAIVETNPGIDLGMDGAVEEASLHVIVGRY